MQSDHTHAAKARRSSKHRSGSSTSPQRRLRGSSKNAYQRDLQLFFRFGGQLPCTAQDLETYVEKLRGKVSPLTIRRRIMAIRHETIAQGHPNPVDERLSALLRWMQTGKLAPRNCKFVPMPPEPKPTGRSAKPITRSLLSRLLDAVLRTMLDRRDEALLLLSFMGALKRSQVVAIDVADVSFTADAMLVRLRGDDEPTDTRGRAPRTLAIPKTEGPLCAASSVRRYIEHLALTAESPLFCSFNRAGEPTTSRLDSAYVSSVLKRRLKVVGIDPAGFSGESLRIGRLQELGRGVL